MFWHLKLKKKGLYFKWFIIMCVLIGNTPCLLWCEPIDVINCNRTCCSESHTPDCPLWPKLSSLTPIWCRAWIWTSSHWLASHFASSTGYWHSFSASVKGGEAVFLLGFVEMNGGIMEMSQQRTPTDVYELSVANWRVTERLFFKRMY